MFSWASEIDGVQLKENVDLARFTTIKIVAIGSIAIVDSEKALTTLLHQASNRNIKYHLLGWGANQVISKTENTLFIKLNFDFDRNYLKEPKQEYELPASIGLNVLQSHAQKFGLKGWEVITGIPASLGGAIFMNAGTALGEIAEIVKSVRIMKADGTIREHVVDTSSFSYRTNNFVKEGEVILSAKLINKGQDESVSQKIKDYMQYRKSTQPLRSHNCGCVWKNFDEHRKAGLYVDKSGLSKLKVGDLEVSEMHSNFFENTGAATYDDFSQLSELLREQLLLHTGIRFELEAKIY